MPELPRFDGEPNPANGPKGIVWSAARGRRKEPLNQHSGHEGDCPVLPRKHAHLNRSGCAGFLAHSFTRYLLAPRPKFPAPLQSSIFPLLLKGFEYQFLPSGLLSPTP